MRIEASVIPPNLVVIRGCIGVREKLVVCILGKLSGRIEELGLHAKKMVGRGQTVRKQYWSKKIRRITRGGNT